MPTVSIVVPNYNHAKFLTERFDSILNQTYQDFELILLDDCSTDDSRTVISRYSGHPKVSHVVSNTENSGSPFKQWKKGITLASGKYIWLAESDDWADPSFLEALVPVLNNSPAVGVAYCQSIVVDETSNVLFNNKRWTDSLDDKLWSHVFQLKGSSAILDFFVYKCIVPNASAALFRKEIFQGISPALEGFRYAGDWQAWIEMLLESDLYFTPVPLNYFRTHANVTRKRKTSEERMGYFLEAYSIIGFVDKKLSLTQQEQKKVYDFLAKKIVRKFGLKYILSWKGLLLSKKIISFDPQFRRRMFALVLGRFKGKVQSFFVK